MNALLAVSLFMTGILICTMSLFGLFAFLMIGQWIWVGICAVGVFMGFRLGLKVMNYDV
jgi:hypothetical protein